MADKSEVLVSVVPLLVNRDRRRAVVFGLIEAAELDQRIAEVVVAEVLHGRITRLACQHLPVALDRCRPVRLVLMDAPEREVRPGRIIPAAWMSEQLFRLFPVGLVFVFLTTHRPLSFAKETSTGESPPRAIVLRLRLIRVIELRFALRLLAPQVGRLGTLAGRRHHFVLGG